MCVSCGCCKSESIGVSLFAVIIYDPGTLSDWAGSEHIHASLIRKLLSLGLNLAMDETHNMQWISQNILKAIVGDD